LIDQFGPEQMDAFLAAIRSGLTIDPALEEVYGFDTGGLDARWRLSLGYVATPTSAAANAQAAATPTLVPTIGLVAPPVMATPTTTPTTVPAQATATTRPDPTATDIPPTATAAEVVAVITQTPADHEETAVAATASVEKPAENGSSGTLLWILVIGVVVLAAAIILIRVFR
jgi:cobalamin biosynthesis Mg chelatase CobN